MADRREPGFLLETSNPLAFALPLLAKDSPLKKLVPILLLFALVLTACGGGSNAVAATVDGVDITVGEVEGLIDVEGSTIPVDQFAQFLGFEIQWQVVEVAAMEDYGVEITEGEITAEADRIYNEAGQGQSREEFVASRGVTEEFLANIAHQGLIDTAVREAVADELPGPSPEEIQAEMDLAVSNLTEVCVSHILVPTEEEAQDAMDRVTTDGEEFGAVAAELSQDPGSAENDGILPCSTAGTYVPEFRDASLVAPIGEVHADLVETQFGFHVMLVTDRVDPAEGDLPTEEDIAANLTATAAQNATNEWFFEAISDADITVVEEYGTWNSAPPQPGVVPPAA